MVPVSPCSTNLPPARFVVRDGGDLQVSTLDFRVMLGLVLLSVGGALALSLVGTFVVRRCAIRFDFVDRPAGHKGHEKPVALGGGIAIAFAIVFPIVVGTFFARVLGTSDLPSWVPQLYATHAEGIASKLEMVLAICGGAMVLHIVGLIDDRRALGPLPKFAVQIAVALFIAGPMGIRAVEALGAPISIALTTFWIVLITNAFNFLDNMDGLSAGVAMIAAAIFGVTSMMAGQVFVPVLAWVVAGSLLGFLVFNFSPASIFMGDAGSLVVGYMMAVLTILTTFYDPSKGTEPLGVIVPVVVLAVPLYDVTSVVIHRLRLGLSPFRGDRRHFSHRLVRKGLTERGAVLTIYLATAATGLPAILLPTTNWTGAILILLQCLCVVMIIAILEHTENAEPAD